MIATRPPGAAPSARGVRGGRAGRELATLLLASALLLPAQRAACGTGDPRTLVLRGRVLAPDGTPVSGAIITARGSMTTSAASDDRGRYSFSLPIGSAASLKRGAFTLEVRAEQGSRRLAFGSGAAALGLEVSLTAGGARVHVRSNSPAATSALASAFAQDGPATAWIEADFGGASHPGGALVMNAVDDVSLDGSAIPAPRARDSVPVPRERAPAPRENPRVEPTPKPATSAPPATSGKPAPAPAAPAHASAPPTTSAPVVIAPTLPDTLPHVRVADARATARLTAKARRDSAHAARVARARAAHAPSVSVSLASGPGTTPGAPAKAQPPTTRIVDAPKPAETADTCACRVRGTVEIDWDRPLERDFPVLLTLEGPATQHAEVDMFIGSPREFRFGPLPCGEYRLLVQPRGRLHYTLARGDSLVNLSCHGLTQPRVVLVPARR